MLLKFAMFLSPLPLCLFGVLLFFISFCLSFYLASLVMSIFYVWLSYPTSWQNLPILLVLWPKLSMSDNSDIDPLLWVDEVSGDIVIAGHYCSSCCWKSQNVSGFNWCSNSSNLFSVFKVFGSTPFFSFVVCCSVVWIWNCRVISQFYSVWLQLQKFSNIHENIFLAWLWHVTITLVKSSHLQLSGSGLCNI